MEKNPYIIFGKKATSYLDSFTFMEVDTDIVLWKLAVLDLYACTVAQQYGWIGFWKGKVIDVMIINAAKYDLARNIR